MEYGEIFQAIRKNKGLTLKDVAGATISSAQLSRFENGKTMLTIDQFFICLEKMNTTIEEFQFMQKNTWREKYGRIVLELEVLASKKDVTGLMLASKKYFSKSQKRYDWYYFFGCFFENIAIFQKKETRGHLRHVGELTEFFLKSEHWGEMELRVFGMFVFVFDEKTINYLLQIAVKRGKFYQAVSKDRRLFYCLLNNCFSIFVFHKKFEEAKKVLLILEKETNEKNDLLFPQINFLFNKGIICFIDGEIEKATTYCNQAISICRIFNQKQQAAVFSRRLAMWDKEQVKEEFEELVLDLSYLLD